MFANIAYPPSNLPTHLITYPHTYLPTHTPTYLPTYLPTHLLTYLPTHLLTYLPTYVHIYPHALTYLPTHLPTYLPSPPPPPHTHTYLSTHPPTYIWREKKKEKWWNCLSVGFIDAASWRRRREGGLKRGNIKKEKNFFRISLGFSIRTFPDWLSLAWLDVFLFKVKSSLCQSVLVSNAPYIVYLSLCDCVSSAPKQRSFAILNTTVDSRGICFFLKNCFTVVL